MMRWHRFPWISLFVVVLAVQPLSAQTTGGTLATKENLDLPFDALGSEDTDEEAPQSIVFYGQQYEGDGIFYCLDRSGSTSDGELAIEKREVTRNIMEFSDRVQFGIVFYDAGVTKYPSSGRPAEASAAVKSAALAFVSAVQSGHGTCVGLGLRECLKMANQSTSRRNIVIYLGDGYTTCPGAGSAQQYGQKVLGEVQSQNVKRAKVNAICVGTQSEVSEWFPKQLAAMNNGTYSRVLR